MIISDLSYLGKHIWQALFNLFLTYLMHNLGGIVKSLQAKEALWKEATLHFVERNRTVGLSLRR